MSFFPAIWGLIDEKTPKSFTTLDQVFEDGLKTGRERGFLGYRPVVSMNPFKLADRYEWITWGEVDDQRRYIGSALHDLFSKGEVGGGDYETVGIWSANRPGVLHLDAHTCSRLTSAEWQILDIAMQNYKKVSVSLYDTLGKDAVGKIQTFGFSALINIFRLLFLPEYM
jgi:long-chain acyl-CoA synthetase